MSKNKSSSVRQDINSACNCLLCDRGSVVNFSICAHYCPGPLPRLLTTYSIPRHQPRSHTLRRRQASGVRMGVRMGGQDGGQDANKPGSQLVRISGSGE